MGESFEIINSILASGALVTVVIVYFAIEAVKKTDLVHNKYLPLVAMLVGLVIGVILGFVNGGSLVEGGTLGVLSGGFASGLYKAIFPNTEEKLDSK